MARISKQKKENDLDKVAKLNAQLQRWNKKRRRADIAILKIEKQLRYYWSKKPRS